MRAAPATGWAAPAKVAELADAPDSGSGGVIPVRVQLPSFALKITSQVLVSLERLEERKTTFVGSVTELLRTLDALALPAIALDPVTFTLIGATASGARLLGISSKVHDATWLDRVHPEDRVAFEESIGQQNNTRLLLRFASDPEVFRVIDFEIRSLDDASLVMLNEPKSDAPSERPPLEALLEALPFEVWERDAKGVLIRQNAQALRNWGAQLGRSVDDMGLEPHVAATWKMMNARALQGEVVSMPIDYEVAGKRVTYVNLIAPVREHGVIRGVVGVNIDITATRFAEAELARAQEQLVQRERLAALGELAAVVAHEVRNPLGSIFNSLSSLRRQLTLTGDALLLFGILEEEAARLNRTVADLLNYVRPLEPERRPEDLLELAQDALRKGLRTLREGSGPIASKVVASEPIAPLAADPVLLGIALSNLVTNAVQAMPEGGSLTISIDRATHGGREAVAITVNDSGKGIPEEVLTRVFEPFFTTRASGTGLGLAVVRRIAEAHEGAVTVESVPLRGTAFTLLLPR
jgi:signal transduction histidine kinase